MRIPISSIGDAAKKLRAIQRNWTLYSFTSHRRAALISEQLPKVSAKPIVFGAESPKAPLGSWTLIDADTILASRDVRAPSQMASCNSSKTARRHRAAPI